MSYSMLVDLDRQYLLDVDKTHGKSDKKVLKENLQDVFVNEWQTDLNRIGAKKGEGQNKLRT